MTANYYKKVADLLKYLEDNNIVLESCGCCDGIIVDGEGGWDTRLVYSMTVSNEGIKEWLTKEGIKNETKED